MLRITLVALAALVAALPATAQRAIEIGETASGSLRAGTPQRWSLDVPRGTLVTVAVESDDFDPVVEVLDPAGSQIGRDDDGGDGLNSLLAGLRLPRSGRYQIVVSAYSASASGRYTLRVDDGGPARPEASRAIRYGESGDGYLNAGERHGWTFMGTSGDEITADLTGDFDTYLELIGPGGQEVARDDDSGDGNAARLAHVQLPTSGRYTLIARGFSPSGAGRYTLSLDRGQTGRPTGECAGWAEYGSVGVGSRLRLGRHRTVAGGSDNWATGMNAYVGRDATVTRLGGTDSDGCTVVHVDADGGTYMWRLRDATVLPRRTGTRPPTGAACRRGAVADYAGVRVGTEITLGRHEMVNGSENWADEMEAFVGRRTRVTSLGGVDEQGCAVVRVEADNGDWMWRVRDAVRW